VLPVLTPLVQAALALLQLSPIPPSTVRDTIARIVTERGFRESITTTLLSRFWTWFSRILSDLFREAAGSRGTYLVSLSILTLLAVAAIARSVILARARRVAAARRDVPETAEEQLAQARSLAEQKLYLQAAHLLYAALITRLVEEKRVRRHRSKTVGDYARELRASGDSAAPAYRAFAATYDVVAYGDGVCDSARFARLEALAAPVLQGTAASVTRAA